MENKDNRNMEEEMDTASEAEKMQPVRTPGKPK